MENTTSSKVDISAGELPAVPVGTPLTDGVLERLGPGDGSARMYERNVWLAHARAMEGLLYQAQEQSRLGWERAAEKDRAYGQALAERDFNFEILKDCHRILQMADDQSYSLIPGEIEEWMCSHGLVKEKEVKATNRAVRLQVELDALKPQWKVGDMAILAVVGGPRWVKILRIHASGQATTLAVKDGSVGYYHTNAFLDVAGYLKHCDRMRDEWTGKEYKEMQEKAREPVIFPPNWEEAVARASDHPSTQ